MSSAFGGGPFGGGYFGGQVDGSDPVVTPPVTGELFYFVPPVRYAVPTTTPKRHPGNALFRHFAPRAEGVNVYLYADGTVTETDPVSDLDPLRVFHGGHIHTVDSATADLLVAAGYTVVSAPTTPPVTPPTPTAPGFGAGGFSLTPFGS